MLENMDDVIYDKDNEYTNGYLFILPIKNGSRFSIGKYRKTMFHVDQYFNWFQKLMWKWCFGVKVEDYSEE